MDKPIRVNLLERSNQLIEKPKDLPSCQRHAVHQLSKGLSLRVLHQNHNVEPHEGTALPHQLVDRVLTATVRVGLVVVRIR